MKYTRYAIYPRTLLFLLFTLILAACSPEAAPTAEPTAAPTDVPAPTETAIPPTATPIPPTATPEPTPEPVVLEDSEQFADESLGISLDYPAEWTSESMFGMFTMFASNPDVIEQDAIGDGAVAILIVAPSEEKTIEEMLEEEADFPDDAEMIVEPEPITIDGRDGLHAIAQVSEEGNEFYADVYAVEGDGAIYMLMFITEPTYAEKYTPIFSAMVDSIEIGTPDLEAMMGNMGDMFGDIAIDPSPAETIDGGELTVNSITTVTLNAPMAYTVEVKTDESYLFAVAGGVDLTLSLADADGNEIAAVDGETESRPEVLLYSAETDTTLTVTAAPYARSGNAMIAVYTVAAQSTDTLTIDKTDDTLPIVVAQPSDTLDAVLVVDGEEYDSAGEGSAEIQTMSDLAAGSYEATVTAFGDTSGDHTLSVAYVDASFADATMLGVTLPDTLEQVELDTVTEIMLGGVGYTFSLPDDAPYVLMAVGNGSDLQLELLDADNRIYTSIDQGAVDELETFVFNDTAGDYTVVPTAYLEDSGTGQLSIRALQVDEAQSDTVALTITDDGVRPILFAISESDADQDTIIVLTDTDGNEITRVDNSFTASETFDTIDLSVGEYVATVSLYGGESGEAIIGFIEPDAVFARSSSLPADVQTLELGDVVTASTTDGGFNVTSSAEAPAVLLATANDADIVLSIYDENNVLVETVDQSGTQEAERYMMLEDGSFTIVPSAFLADSADFTISLLEIQIVEEDTFDFNVGGDTLSLIFAIPDAETDVVLTVFDADGEEVTSYDWAGAGSLESIATDTLELPAGDYSAKVTIFDDAEGEFSLAGVEISAEQLGGE